MRVSDHQTKIRVGNKTHKAEFIFCDICGHGNYIKYYGVIVNTKTYDFCSKHTDQQINHYIENDKKS